MNKKLKFKDVSGTTLKSPEAWVKEFLRANPSSRVYVGTDSQRIGRGKATYVTVIAFRLQRGAKYIYAKEIKAVKGIEQRLYHEAEVSVETAVWLKSHLPYVDITVEFDYNGAKSTKSSSLKTLVSWANSLGFKGTVKPHEQVAVKAADHHSK